MPPFRRHMVVGFHDDGWYPWVPWMSRMGIAMEVIGDDRDALWWMGVVWWGSTMGMHGV